MPFIINPTPEILWGPAPIDWCEPNHPEVNPFGVQEYHNTWTNIAYVLAGGIPLVWSFTRNKHLEQDPLYTLSCMSVILTGITSAWFHATLIYAAQKSDEFFESCAVLFMAYCMGFPLVSTTTIPNMNEYKMKRFFIAMTHCLLLGLGVLYIPEVFCEVHLLLAVLCAVYFFSVKRIPSILNLEDRAKALKCSNTGVIISAIGFAFWIIDMAFCTPFVQSLNLHAYAWHFCTAFGLYNGCIVTRMVDDLIWKQQNGIKNT